MNVALTDEMRDFVQKKVENGQYPSEEAVIEAALQRLRDQEDPKANPAPTLDELIDHDFVDYCVREADDGANLDDVLRATSTIEGSMARVIIDEERADRF